MPISPFVFPLFGGCGCSAVRYQLLKPPLAIQACHCTYCQRESGAAFALNSLIESDFFEITSEVTPTKAPVPTKSGHDQEFYRCPRCQVAVFSYYNGGRDFGTFVKTGTLDRVADPEVGLKPDAHIFTSTKQPWLKLEEDVPQFKERYKMKELWSEESLKRWKEMLAKRQQPAAKSAGEERNKQAKF